MRALTTFPPTRQSDLALAGIVVLRLETKDAFLKLLARLREEYLPTTHTESVLVWNIAIDRWWQQR